jgi:hypothetical protein
MKRILLGLLVAGTTFAQSNPLYIQFRPGATKGALYKPDKGPAPHIAILLAHRTSNFMNHLATRELSARGFLVLGMNPRSDNNEAAVNWEENALDVKQGVEFLRKQPGIAKVLLLAHSGGGPTMSFYQAVAEQGLAYCRGPNKLTECPDELAGLPKADGIIFVDAHPGNSVNVIRSLSPAVIDESNPKKVDPALDPYNPANGYKADGTSSYSAEFQKKYFAAQAARMNRLIDKAAAERKAMKAGTAPYTDDDVMIIVRGEGARLMELDRSIHHTTEKPRKLLKNDGTVVTQIVENVRPAARISEKVNASFKGGTRVLTLESFLSTNAIRGTDSMSGLDWCSSNNSVPCALKSISVPILITTMGGHYFMRDNEIHYEVAASKDKDFIVIEGATHNITPCTACEKTPGQYSNVTKNWSDYVAKWINDRF